MCLIRCRDDDTDLRDADNLPPRIVSTRQRREQIVVARPTSSRTSAYRTASSKRQNPHLHEIRTGRSAPNYRDETQTIVAEERLAKFKAMRARHQLADKAPVSEPGGEEISRGTTYTESHQDGRGETRAERQVTTRSDE